VTVRQVVPRRGSKEERHHHPTSGLPAAVLTPPRIACGAHHVHHRDRPSQGVPIPLPRSTPTKWLSAKFGLWPTGINGTGCSSGPPHSKRGR